MKSLKLTFQPLTKNHWPDFEQLFGEQGACGGCWWNVCHFFDNTTWPTPVFLAKMAGIDVYWLTLRILISLNPLADDETGEWL